MTINKRGDKFVVRMEEDRAGGGQRKQIYRRFNTLREARAFEAEVLEKRRAGVREADGRQSYREFVETRFLPSVVARGARQSTVYNYTRWFQHHILPELGHLRLDQISTLMLDDLYKALAKKPVISDSRRGQLLSQHSIAHIHTLISMSFRAAQRWKLRVDNPAAGASAPSKRVWRKEAPAWTAAEAVAFLSFLQDKNDRDYALVFTLLATGLRRGEALGLMWSDVDWDRKTLAVRRALVQTPDHQLEFAPTKSARGVRTLAVDDVLLSVLRQQEKVQRLSRWAAGPLWEETGLVFTTRTGGMLRPGNVSSRLTALMRQAGEALGISVITTHGLRHTNISLSVTAGIHAKVVSERAGHHSASYTLDTYAHLSAEGQRGAAEAITQLLADPGPKRSQGELSADVSEM